MSNFYRNYIKEIVGVVLSFGGIIILIPLFIWVAYKIHKETPGPVFYKSLRIGKNGKTFQCYKFRSMFMTDQDTLKVHFKNNPESLRQWEQYHKLDDDPRITAFGRFIRRTSIDELPQLLNVIRGEMSLVGPRPYLCSEEANMGEYYTSIIKIKPGITGYWQVNGRSNLDFKQRLVLDSWYVENEGPILDLKLLCQTISIVFAGKGAK